MESEQLKTKILGNFVWILPVVTYLILGLYIPLLFTSSTIQNVLVHGTAIGLLGIAVAFPLIVGEFDISIVGVAGFTPMIGIILIRSFGVPTIIAIFLVLLIGVLIGLFNGLVVTRIGVPSLIQTLAMWWILTGCMMVITKGLSFSGFSTSWNWLGCASIGPLRVLTIFFIVVTVLVWLYSRHGVSGRRLFLVGGSPDAAKSMGIHVNRYKVLSFMFSGFFAALAGYTLSARMGVITPTFCSGLLMPAIAVPVIAGVSLKGGRGNLLQILAATYLIQIFVTSLRVGGVSGFYFTLAQGLLVFFAVLADSIRKKVMGEE